MDYGKMISLVYQAREIVFGVEYRAEHKDANPYDFITAVDTGISDFMKKELGKAFPDVGFMTEEEREHTLYDKAFILDPIDGTTNLVYDYRMSSVSLAYVENRDVKFGVVFNPFSNELFFAIKGKGAHIFNTEDGIEPLLSGGIEHYCRPICASERPLGQSLIEFGAGSSRKKDAKETFETGKRVFERCLDIRRTCSTALAICYIAAGRLDGYFEKVIKPWDYAAGILILAEAGGRATDWDGCALPLDRPGTIICANKTNYGDLLKAVLG